MTEVDALGAWTPEEEKGIKDEELWSLDATLTHYILPRITAFRKMKRVGYPIYEPLGTEDKYLMKSGRPLKSVAWLNGKTFSLTLRQHLRRSRIRWTTSARLNRKKQ